MNLNLEHIKALKFQFFILVTLLVFSEAVSQSFDLATGSREQPIEITADDGIEWQRENQLMVATGNAKATRGNATIESNILRAYYQRNKKGETRLTKIEALQKVKIKSPTQHITGQNAVYDLEKAILVVSGKIVKLVSGSDVITSNQQMEYFEKKEMAVARKNAIINHDGKKLRAETLVAFFYKDKAGKSKVSRIQAFDNVMINTRTERIKAQKGIYDLKSGIVTLSGNVRISRGKNQLNGDNAIINLNTGVSKLLASNNAKSPQKKKRIRGYLMPKRN